MKIKKWLSNLPMWLYGCMLFPLLAFGLSKQSAVYFSVLDIPRIWTDEAMKD
ncbi:hypothetical protein [Belliella pelovolcani]|uniref:hypothetical protein n=1 Tax=Belliella pelovolcani TaxID=529505 RepID=UPI00391CF033